MRNAKKYIQVLLLIICLGAFVVITIVSNSAGVSDVRFQSKNSSIDVSWSVSNPKCIREIKLSVEGNGVAYEETLPRTARTYSFTDGTHGVLYNISLTVIYADDRDNTVCSEERLFLDFNLLPDFPTLYIETETGQDPPWTQLVKTDETVWGESITDNIYIPGSIEFENMAQIDSMMPVKIRARGNTSTALAYKPCYKIIFDQAVDLLSCGTSKKEWILLNSGAEELKNNVGQYIQEVCDVEYLHRGMLVNVMLNGDWKGLYYLTEALQEGDVEKTVISLKMMPIGGSLIRCILRLITRFIRWVSRLNTPK